MVVPSYGFPTGRHTHCPRCGIRFDLVRTWVCEPPHRVAFLYAVSGTPEPCQDGDSCCRAVRRLLIAVLAMAASPVLAQVDPKTHKLCLEAKDYQGCVKAMTTAPADQNKVPSTIRVIEGERELTGNSCPADMAYAGSGWCSNVICVSRSSGHSPGLGGKNWSCPKIFGMGYAMSWGDSKVKATYDPSCPKEPPEIGWRSSCEQNDHSWIKQPIDYDNLRPFGK